MADQDLRQIRTACFPTRAGSFKRIAGIALILAGTALILFCVPYWAWWALLGAALILAGLVLARNG